jgi:hypothetical protein
MWKAAMGDLRTSAQDLEDGKLPFARLRRGFGSIIRLGESVIRVSEIAAKFPAAVDAFRHLGLWPT